jgi:hypothetical protein
VFEILFGLAVISDDRQPSLLWFNPRLASGKFTTTGQTRYAALRHAEAFSELGAVKKTLLGDRQSLT